MKFFVVPILIFLIATQAFSKWVVLLEYNMNKDYFAKVLCENKAKPQLKCGGKCAVMKKMAEEEKQNSSTNQNGPAKLKFAEILFAFESSEIIFQPTVGTQRSYPAKDKAWMLFDPLCSVFRPPSLLR